jgi:hypothetical protein
MSETKLTSTNLSTWRKGDVIINVGDDDSWVIDIKK